MRSKCSRTASRLQNFYLFLVPRTMGCSVSPQRVPVVAEGQVLGADGHGTGVSSSWGRGKFVFAVLVVVAHYGAVLVVVTEGGNGRGGGSEGGGFGYVFDAGEGCGDGLEDLWATAEGVVVEGADEEESGVVEGGLLMHFECVGANHGGGGTDQK